jgi:uncharacterized protein (AIM24 family)
MEIFKKGDIINLTLDDKTVQATVYLASPNGISLFVSFDDYLGGYLGKMPILYNQQINAFTDLIEGRQLILKKQHE